MFRRADLGIVGNEDAGRIVRDKGFLGVVEVVPQFGIDPELFQPDSQSQDATAQRPFTIGFVGRLTEAKGLGVLLDAVSGLTDEWRLRIIGSGPDRGMFEHRART